MLCENCKNEFDEPMRGLSESARYCPLCLAPVRTGAMRCTAENMTAYTQSEILFAQKKYARAVDLCLSSALTDNPYAAVNMGFYCENGYYPSVSDEARIRSAFEWYDMAARYNERYRALRVNNAPPPAAEHPDEALILRAVKNVMCLLLNYGIHAPAGQFVLDGEFNAGRSAVAGTLADIVKADIGNYEEYLPAEQSDRAAAFFDSFTADLVMGFRKVDAELLGQLTAEKNQTACTHLLNEYALWIVTVTNQVFQAGNYANLRALAAQKTDANPVVTLAFFRRDAKKAVYRSKYKGGGVSVSVRLNSEAFADALKGGGVFGRSVNYAKNDIVLAKKHDRKEILALCT